MYVVQSYNLSRNCRCYLRVTPDGTGEWTLDVFTASTFPTVEEAHERMKAFCMKRGLTKSPPYAVTNLKDL